MSFPWLPLVLVSLAAVAPAQIKSGRELPKGVTGEENERGDKEQFADGKLGEPAAPVRMTPRGKCTLRASLHPERLMPGQTGLLKIVMVLEGDAVMESPGSVSLTPQGRVGVFDLGAMALLPPRPGNVAEAYRNRPVYDNFALIEVPVRMSEQVELGKKHVLTLQASFQLHEGASGRLLGDFAQGVSVTCEIGKVDDPMVQMPAPTARVSVPPDSVGPVAVAEPESGAVTPSVGPDYVAQGAMPVASDPRPAQPDVTEPAGSGGPLAVADEGSPMTIVLLAGGGLVGIIVLMLALARKK